MAKAIITFKLMPESPDVDLKKVLEAAEKIAKQHGALGQMQAKEEPIAFGLKAVILMAMYTVEGGNFEAIAEEMQKIKHVQSAEVASMDLALG